MKYFYQNVFVPKSYFEPNLTYFLGPMHKKGFSLDFTLCMYEEMNYKTFNDIAREMVPATDINRAHNFHM